MEKLQGIVGELVGILAALGGAYFFVGFIANLVQAQVSTVTGDSIGKARALQQGIGMVMLLCVAVSVGPLTSGLVRHFYGSGFSSPSVLTSEGSIYSLWSELASMVAYIIVGSGMVLLTVGAVYAGLGLQVAKLIGMPIGVGRAAGNLITVIMGLAVTAAALGLSKGIIGIIFQSAG
ncbi:MAG: hypothetical protein WBB65_10630 [Anaerolineales bacterium]